MVLMTNAFAVFDAIGNREDLTDLLTNITPREAPLYDAMGVGNKPTAVLHEWGVDTLPAANADNVTLEGETFAADATTATTRLSNRVVISTKELAVTEIQEVVAKGGRTSEVAYQKAKAIAALKRDFEAMLFNYGTGASAGAGSATVPRRMSNVHYWILSCTGVTGYSGLGTVAIATSISENLTGLSIAEGTFNKIMQDIWDEGGRPNACYLNGSLKRKVSDWGTSTSRVWAGERKITNAVDVYEGDFATLELKKERHCASSIGYFLDESLWKKAIMLPVGEVNIGKTAMATPVMLRQAWTIEARNASGNGLFISS